MTQWVATSFSLLNAFSCENRQLLVAEGIFWSVANTHFRPTLGGFGGSWFDYFREKYSTVLFLCCTSHTDTEYIVKG